MKTFGKMETAHYYILNLNVSIESDSKDLLDRFDQDYGWFRTPNGTGRSSLMFSAQFHSNDPGLACTRTPLVNDSEDSRTHSQHTGPSDAAILHSLLGHPSPISYALQQIVRTLFSELTEYMVLHAGVLEKDGQALILSGPPGVGKSTLTMALLEHGFGFLSDDFCPIERRTGLVHPFPRSVWVVDAEQKATSPGGRPGKRRIASDQLPGSVCPSPCIPKWLICLDPGESGRHIQLEAGIKAEGAEAFVQDMAQIEGVRLTRLRPDLQEWHVHYPSAQRISDRVRKVIDRHRDAIWNLYRSDRACPDFGGMPAIETLSTHKAALRLLSELKQEPDSLTGDADAKGKAGALFMELAGLLENVDCYRMTSGRLDEMVKVILHHICRVP